MAKDTNNNVIVKVADQTVANMTGSAKRGTTAERSMKKNQGKCWAVTALWLNTQRGLATYDATKPEKDLAEELRMTFKKGFLAEYGEIPEKGLNARTGESFVVINPETGEIKWSSWEETKAPMSYMRDFAKIISKGKVDDLLVSDEEVAPRPQMLKACKEDETSMAACERGVKLIEENFTGLTAEELKSLSGRIEALTITLSDALELSATGTDGV